MNLAGRREGLQPLGKGRRRALRTSHELRCRGRKDPKERPLRSCHLSLKRRFNQVKKKEESLRFTWGWSGSEGRVNIA